MYRAASHTSNSCTWSLANLLHVYYYYYIQLVSSGGCVGSRVPSWYMYMLYWTAFACALLYLRMLEFRSTKNASTRAV